MIELGKYGAYVIAAYSVTILILVSLSIQTLVSFTKTKNKLTEVSQRKTLVQ